jgi:hypothetical protein
MAPCSSEVQIIMCAEHGQEETVHELTVLDKACQRIEHLGLTLADAKQLLTTLQHHLVEQQTSTLVAAHAQCVHYGKAVGVKGHHMRTFGTLFGTITLTSLRLYHCHCQPRKTTTLRPLNVLLTDAVAPKLLFIVTKWASLVSYGPTAQALKDFHPLDATLNETTVQNHLLAVAKRCENELGEEQWALVEGCPADWAALPPLASSHGHRRRVCPHLEREKAAFRSDRRQEYARLLRGKDFVGTPWVQTDKILPCYFFLFEGGEKC